MALLLAQDFGQSAWVAGVLILSLIHVRTPGCTSLVRKNGLPGHSRPFVSLKFNMMIMDLTSEIDFSNEPRVRWYE